MKRLLKLQKDTQDKREHIEKLYGLDYFNIDSTSISARRNTASLYYAAWDNKPKITMVCGDKEAPDTYEEFIKVKAQHQLDIEHMNHIAAIWKKAIT